VRLGALAAAPAHDATRLTVAGDGPNVEPLLRLDTPVANPRRPEERIGTLVALLDPTRLLGSVAADRLQREAITAILTADGTLLATVGTPSDARESLLAEHVAMAPLRDVEAPAFTIDVRQPAGVALAGVAKLRGTLIRSALLVMLLSGIAGGLFAWRLSVPIRRLTASVQQVTARGEPAPIDGAPRGSGEVGVLADAFNAMLQRLVVAQRESVAQSRLALLGEIAASIVHDVRTPLSVLKTSAQLLGSATLSVAEQRDLAGLIASEVDRLNRVVTNLADLGRPPPQARCRQSVRELVERTVAVLRPWAQARGVMLEAVGDADSRVHADPDQLLQGLLNVIHNAAQASPAGSRVQIRWDAEPPWVVIAVRDAGPGFSADALERIFSPFFTTKPDGTGLGLAITKRIVEAHEGTIDVGNADGGGARVSLRLPLAA